MAFSLSSLDGATFDPGHVAVNAIDPGPDGTGIRPGGQYTFTADDFLASLADLNGAQPAQRITSITTQRYTGPNDPPAANVVTYTLDFADGHSVQGAVKIVAVSRTMALGIALRGFTLANGSFGATLDPANTVVVSFGATLDVITGTAEPPVFPLSFGQDGTGGVFDPAGAVPQPPDPGAAGEQIIGDTGPGTVLVHAGRTVDVGTALPAGVAAVVIGLSAGSSGLLTVTDAGTRYAAHRPILVGYGGTGTLSERAGANLDVTAGAAGPTDPVLALIVGGAAGGTGTATVDGLGTTATVTGEVDVGRLGVGTLTVSNGAVLAAANATSPGRTAFQVADGPASGGSAATISGAGSRLDFAGQLVIGNFADGSLAVLAGGTVDSLGGFDPNLPDVVLGARASGTGRILVDGIGSLLDAGGGEIHLGGNVTGSGALAVRNAGTVHAARLGLTNGTVSLDATGRITLGDGAGTAGRLTVGAGRTLFGAGLVDATVDDQGVVNAVGGTLEITRFDGGSARVGAGAVLRLDNAAGPSAVTFDGATGEVAIGGSATLTLSGFGPGNAIRLLGESGAGGLGLRPGGNDATVALAFSDGRTIAVTLSGDYTGGHISVAAQGADTVITEMPCFAAGTRIATPGGDRAVERLVPGDLVRLADGGAAAVIWIGDRTVDCRRHPRPGDVMPVRVRAHAFGPGSPVADLRLSPDHAVLVADPALGDALVPVRHLITAGAVVQEAVDEIVYYHVELARHAVLLAEGLPVESYLDAGNRAAFARHRGCADAGRAAVVQAVPRFAPAERLAFWQARACAPLSVDGPIVEAAKARLREKAGGAMAA